MGNQAWPSVSGSVFKSQADQASSLPVEEDKLRAGSWQCSGDSWEWAGLMS